MWNCQQNQPGIVTYFVLLSASPLLCLWCPLFLGFWWSCLWNLFYHPTLSFFLSLSILLLSVLLPLPSTSLLRLSVLLLLSEFSPSLPPLCCASRSSSHLEPVVGHLDQCKIFIIYDIWRHWRWSAWFKACDGPVWVILRDFCDVVGNSADSAEMSGVKSHGADGGGWKQDTGS